MKKIIVIIVGFILLLCTIVYLFVLKSEPSEESGEEESSSNAFTENPTTVPATDTLTLKTQSIQSLSLRNFLLGEGIYEDKANPGLYYLQYTPESVEAKYNISYVAESQFFNITLLKTPLSEVRLDAEAYLQAVLGISNQQMCGLRYTVSTTFEVSNQLAGQNFGFSFCPGAVSLP